MNRQTRLSLVTACLGAVMGIAAQAQQAPTPGYGMWQQPSPEQQRQMWENMQRGGYGPGMMGGGSGYGMGMGPGMMGGYGPGYGMGMGPGMMGGWQGLDLNESQLDQWDKIHDKLQDKHRKLMRQMWQEQARLADLYNAEKRDPTAIGKSHDNLAKLQREAIEARIEAENKLIEILTKEQKAQFRRNRGWGMMGY
ncbi:periplasmic heavy metal sensor [Betaproteobacteria bacterium SCN2]|jgi:Spy/CpxP family protein refolding chaperone|nr:periplasmic heavy metal sensor [Betaproteobacteria bacterium SCN2]